MTEPASELAVVLRASGLNTDKTQVLNSRFADYFTIAQQWEQEAKGLVVSDESQTELMRRARQGRLVLREKRVQLERTRKELKDDSLQEGRAIDAVAKLLTALITPTEDFLLEQEEYAKRAEAARARQVSALIAGRRSLLREYGEDEDDSYLFALSDNDFDLRLQRAERNFARKEELEAETLRLQRETDRRNRDELLRRNQELESQIRRDEARVAKEREAMEAQLQQQQDDLKEARARHAKREHEADQRQQVLLLVASSAPDRQKLTGLADAVGQLSLQLPTLNTPEGQQVVEAVGSLLVKVQRFIRDKSDTL